MEKKVVITQKQANEIERIKREGIPVTWKTDGWYIDRGEELSDISFHLYTKALFVGYEVRPVFRSGDWGFRENKATNGFVITQITKVEGRKIWADWLDEGDLTWSEAHDIRHATPEEIKREKRRRWFAKHDRDVWELKYQDILHEGGNVYYVLETDSEKVTLYSSLNAGETKREWKYIEKWFKVACFAEDRKDL